MKKLYEEFLEDDTNSESIFPMDSPDIPNKKLQQSEDDEKEK